MLVSKWTFSKLAGTEAFHLGLQAPDFVLELQYPFDTGDVEPVVDEGGDLTQPGQVIAAVKACAAGAAPRFDLPPLPLVNPQCLGVQAGKLGGHRDGKHAWSRSPARWPGESPRPEAAIPARRKIDISSVLPHLR